MTTIVIIGKGAPDRGGIAAHLAGLLDSPLVRDHDVRFVNLTRGSAEPAGGRVTTGNIVRTLQDALLVWRAARGADIVSIHSALVPAVTILRAGVLALAGRLRGARVFVHAHGGGLRFWLQGRLRRQFARIALRPCERFVAVAEGERQVLAATFGEPRVALVRNGVDTQRFRPRERREAARPCVLYAGLLTPRKGVIDLFAASQSLVERGLAHDLLLAGGTPDEGREAEQEVRAAAVAHARLLGPQPHDDMPSLYGRADVFVLPSWWEAFPISLLEAMASGLPVIATTVGDVPELVDHEVTGLLVPPKDPAALADALARLLADPLLRARMGAAAQAAVQQRYGLDHCARALESVFLGSHRPAGRTVRLP